MVMLGSICGLVNGKAFKPSDWSTSGVPIVRIQNLNGSGKPFNYFRGSLSNQVRVKGGDLLLAWSGTPGTSFGAHIWQGEAAILNQHIFRCDIDRSTITAEWAKFVINAQLDQLVDLAHGGVGLKHVTRGVVEDLEIPLPTLAEQGRVAKVLDQAETLRAKRRAALAKLDTLTQSIFLDLFGDPLRNLNGFRTRRLIELVDPQRGVSYGVVQRGDHVEDGVPVIRIRDVVDGEISPASLKRTTAAIAGRYRRTILRGGELVISIRGTIGRCAIVPHELAGGNITRELALIPISDTESSMFLLALLRDSAVQQRIVGDVKGVAQRGINLEDLRELPVIQPPKAKVDGFSRQIGALQRLKVAHLSSLTELDALFAVLQHRAFRGEL
jgi:type I restriction enzyme, S subunit